MARLLALLLLVLGLVALAAPVPCSASVHAPPVRRSARHRGPAAGEASRSSDPHIDAIAVPSLPTDAAGTAAVSGRYPLRTPSNSPGMLASNCTLGVDLATPSSVSAFQCMKALGQQFAIVRVFQSNCWLDPHAVDTIHAAWAAGLVVDVYFFPSTGCSLDQAGQIDAALDHLQSNNAVFNRFWIDVEAWQWWAECETNIAWLTPLLVHAQSRLGVKRVGFYAGLNFFTNYMCNTTLYSSMGVPLWYARWNNAPSFENFTSYGGWTQPFMHQFNAVGMCDVHTDSDFRGTADCGNDLRVEWEKEQQLKQQQQPQQQKQLAPAAASSHEPLSSEASSNVHRSKRHHTHMRANAADTLGDEEQLQRTAVLPREPLRLHDPSVHRHIPSFLPAGAPNCTLGVDLATPTSVEAFQCMVKQGGLQHVTMRAFQSNCYLDPHAVDTLHNAAAAGVVADIYIFPSVGCSMSAVQQIDVTLDHLARNNASFHTLWLDVEDWGWAPIEQCQSNLAWLRPLVARAVQRLGAVRVGIYTMATMWSRIACDSDEFAKQGIRLWWAHWSGGQSLDDFAPFGGWTTAAAKQWQDWGVGCGVDVDSDWRPTGDCGLSAEEGQRRMEQQRKDEVVLAELSATTTTAVTVAPAEGNCTIGVDLATPVSATAFQCLRETRGVQFLVVRAFQSNCYVDPHTVDTIHAAWAAGLSGVDVYFFPSVGCSLDAVLQFDATIAHLKQNNATFNRMWFDVEDWNWLPVEQCAQNEAWFTPLYQRAVEVLGEDRVGIYSVTSMWQRIMCPSTVAFRGAQLWYAKWDKQPSFDGFTPFGTWQQPDQKQFTGNDHACDINLDFDFRKDGKCTGR